MMYFMCCYKEKKQSVDGGEKELSYCQGFCGKASEKKRSPNWALKRK